LLVCLDNDIDIIFCFKVCRIDCLGKILHRLCLQDDSFSSPSSRNDIDIIIQIDIDVNLELKIFFA